MKLLAALAGAIAGWRDIALGAQDWRSRFALTGPGLATALVVFALAGFLSVLAANASATPAALALGMGVQASLALAVVLASWGARAGTPVPALSLMVPALYGLTAYVLLGTLAAALGLTLLARLLLIPFAAALFRLGTVADLGAVRAAVLALLALVLLVCLPASLYMLAGSPPSLELIAP